MEIKGGSNDGEEKKIETRSPWERKFLSWKQICHKTCFARQGGQMYDWCLLSGNPCSYRSCPRRAFEEAIFLEENLPPLKPSENFRKKVKKLEKKNKLLEEKVADLEKQRKDS